METDISRLVTGRKVTLGEMLEARELRQHTQRMLISQYQLPVISFTLNIVGPVKVFPLAVKAFNEGVRLIEARLLAWNIPIRASRPTQSCTGRECFWVVEGEACSIKEILCLLEESLSFGRLLDIDVIDAGGGKISRTDIGFSPRKCLICGQDAFVCSRARVHPVSELLEKECSLMNRYFDRRYAGALASLSMQALLYEVSVTPKPGLVDRNNTGAHSDMDMFTFGASAVSLNHSFESFALCGIENGDKPFSRIFTELRSQGALAEDMMMEATGNVNTHKGMIFSLAVMNCSLGYMYANHIPYTPDNLLDTNRKLAADVIKDFSGITIENAKTNGERLYAMSGLKGIRGEALSGYRTVIKTALPVLRSYMKDGFSVNDAGAMTLLHIMAVSEDTNIVRRSSYEEMREIQNTLKKKLGQENRMAADAIRQRHGAYGLLTYMEALDKEFIRRNISPGGSADLLALTFFVFLYEQRFGNPVN